MIYKTLVKKIITTEGFYAPRIIGDDGKLAAIPNELLGEVEINDEVTVFSSELLSYGGFSALVIQTPRATLTV